MKNKGFLKQMLLLWLTAASMPLPAQEAVVVESETVMGTYDFSDPNPVANPENPVYPYFRFDGFSNDKIGKKWKTVELENDYIRVTLFPQIGGKIWGAIDKTSGKEFLYYNHVVKFRDIAMRGAWVSGGIEFNFGIIGHAPTSATPVDYITKKKADGSVSCYIASYEFLTRTFWTVEVNLPKDKAYFTTHTTWNNVSSLRQPYYHWMNAAYQASPEMEFCYPGNHYIGHGGELYTFPKDKEGRNLAWYKENAFESSKSYHVLGFYNDFYGTYWHDRDFGSAHYSPYDEKLGMKIFLWSQARDGAIWEELLTDTDGQYVELQSGRMYNQPATASAETPFKHTSFSPGATDQWTEYWFPVKGTKGIVKGSPAGALNVVRKNGNIELLFSPLQKQTIPIAVFAGNKRIFESMIRCKPLETWTHTIPGNTVPADEKLKVIIGKNELFYSEDEADNIITRPKKIPADFDTQSVYRLYLAGEQWMNQKYYTLAERKLKEALEKDRYFVPALIRLGELYYRWGRYEEALKQIRTALSINTYDGEANYIYGLCNMRLRRYTDAKDGFSLATREPAVKSAAYAALAGLYIREKDWEKATSYAQKSLHYNDRNLSALQELMICLRKSGKKEEAIDLQHKVLEELPLAHGVRYERHLTNPSENSRETFSTLIRNELPQETYFESALWYESVGCEEEALDLLSFIPDYPMACYRKAWLLHRQGKEQDAEKEIEKAGQLPLDFVFPFRAENKEVMKWVRTKTSSWKAFYLSALLEHANGNSTEALALLNGCNDVPFYPFYLYKASFEKGEEQLATLKKAESLEKNPRTGYALIRYYAEQKEWKLANTTAARYHKLFPNDPLIGLQYGTTLSHIGEYKKSIHLLKSIRVLPNEGSYIGRMIYRNANLYEAMAFLKKRHFEKAMKSIENSKIWGENLGVGKPYDDQIDYTLEYFLEAQALALKPEKSHDLLRKVAGIAPSGKSFKSIYLLAAMAQKQLGDTEKAEKWVKSWSAEYPGNPVAAWCAAIYKGDKNEAERLLEARENPSESTPWEATYIDRNFDLIVRLFR